METGKELGSWSEVNEVLVFQEGELEYVDGPIEGFAEFAPTKRRYAFRCQQVLQGRLWHWILLPASDEDGTAVEMIFRRARSSPPATWLSLLEDRRTAQHRVTGVEFHGSGVRPPQ